MSSTWQAGDILGPFTLETALGSGGFGAVWIARRGSQRVALKLLHLQTPEAVRRFDLEAETLTRLDHPNIVRIVEAGEVAGTHFIAMELVAGVTLSEWSRSKRRHDEKLSVLLAVVAGLSHAHRAGVLHRDLKPENILIPANLAETRIVDFGLAKLVGARQPDLTKTGVVLGTPGFMSPEQLRGRPLQTPSDVYALGVIAFEMFAGRPPFTGVSPLALSMSHLNDEVPPLRGISDEIAAVIRGMLTKEPERRASLSAFRRALEGRRGTVLEIDADEPSGTPKLVAGFAAALGLAVAAVVAFGGKETSLPVQSSKRSLPSALVATDDPAELPALVDAGMPARDVGSGADARELLPATSAVSGSPACSAAAEELRPGMQTIAEMPAFIPGRYAHDRPRPLVVALHDFWMTGNGMIRTPGIHRPAGERGWVVLAPESVPFDDTWEHEAIFRRVIERDIPEFGERVCFDKSNIFIVGHGRGGRAVRYLAENLDGVRATATTAFRPWGVSTAPKLAADIPAIDVSVLDDVVAPKDGGKDCFGSGSSWTVDEYEDALKQLHRCDDSTDMEQTDALSCQELACDAPLVLCRAEGGRHWMGMESVTPGLASLVREMIKCKPGQTKAKLGSPIFEFFDRFVAKEPESD